MMSEPKRSASAHSLAGLTGPIGWRVRKTHRDLVACAADYGIRNLAVFGSVACSEEGPSSDLDLLGDVPEDMGLVGLGRARDDFEATVGCPVDLVPFGDLKTDIRDQVEAEMVLL